tara:strand:+ start:211 stop:576 length:366 start_codon:yes stop_codon:yes gene_type:complete
MPQTTRRGQSVCSPLGLGVRSDTSPLPFLCCEDSGDSSFDGTFAGAGYGTFAGGIFAVAGEGDGLGWDLDFGLMLAHMPVEDLPLQVQPLLFIFMFIPSGQQLLSFMFSPQATFPSEQQKN